MRRVTAAANTMGTILGLVLLFMAVTAGIAGYRLWHVQNTLDRAVAAAVQSEAQNGCWTASTTTAVTQILQGAGLPVSGSHAVQVTQYSTPSGTPVDYGQLVTAGLQWSVPIAVVDITLPTSVPVSAQTAATSQYVPPDGGASSNPGCVTPALGSSTNSGSGNSGGGGSSTSGPITVSSVSVDVSNQTVTVTGSNLPILTNGTSTPYGGDDFTNFLWDDPGNGWADGNPSYPYNPDAGVTIVETTSTTLVFQQQYASNALSNGQTWSLYLLPAGQQVGSSSTPVWTGTIGSSSGGSGSQITVSSVSFNGSTVTITGTNLPSLTGATSVPYGTDYQNFLFSVGSSPDAAAGDAVGNTLPYNPDWGITVDQDTSTTITFTPPSSNDPVPGQTWYLYLLPAGQSITGTTAPIWSGMPAGS